jgi:hypothetical protein
LAFDRWNLALRYDGWTQRLLPAWNLKFKTARPTHRLGDATWAVDDGVATVLRMFETEEIQALPEN